MKLSDLFTRIEPQEETADGWLAHCPAHADSQPSLRISVSDRDKVLIRCRAGCDTRAVIEAVGLTMRDLATMEPDLHPERPAGADDVPPSTAQIASLAGRLDTYAAALARDDKTATSARAYAASRFGLVPEDITRLGLGVATDLVGGPRLVVPFRDQDGIPQGFQARALEDDARVRWLGPRNPEGATWAKVGFFPGSSDWDEVLITEGPGDGMTGAALGYDTVCIRGAGLAANPNVVDAVVAMVGTRQAIVAGDGDPAGQMFSATLAASLAEAGLRVRILGIPDGEDLTSWREGDPLIFAREAVRAVMESRAIAAQDAPFLAWDEARYALSDLGAARFVRDYLLGRGSGVRFTPEAGFFLLKHGGIWRADAHNETRTTVHEVADIARRLSDEANEAEQADSAGAPERRRASRWRRFSARMQSSQGIDAVMKEIRAVPSVAASFNDFDQHPDLLAVANGIVDLRTGALRPPDPALLISRRVSYEYNPDAKAPRWEAFLHEVFPSDSTMPDFMRRLVGYGVTGHASEQIFAIHVGKGANGKSVFTDTLTSVFREFTQTTPFSTFEAKPSGGIPNDLAALKGARLVFAAEGEQGSRMAEAVLKRVTGNDQIAARFMRQEFFSFSPQFLLQLSTNFEPSFRGQDEGLWRRVKLIRWERFFAPRERDKWLLDRLREESEGILAWAIAGAREWYAEGLVDSATITEAGREYREASNVLDGFLPGVYVHDEGGGAVLGDVLFRAFQDWADEENHLDLKRWSRRAFYGALGERGVERVKRAGGITFIGIRQARPGEHAEDDAGDDSLRAEETVPSLSSNSADEALTLRGASLDDVL